MHYLPRKKYIIVTTLTLIFFWIKDLLKPTAEVSRPIELPLSPEVANYAQIMRVIAGYTEIQAKNASPHLHCTDRMVYVRQVLAQIGARPFKTVFGTFDYTEAHKQAVEKAVAAGYFDYLDEAVPFPARVLVPTDMYGQRIAFELKFGDNAM